MQHSIDTKSVQLTQLLLLSVVFVCGAVWLMAWWVSFPKEVLWALLPAIAGAILMAGILVVGFTGTSVLLALAGAMLVGYGIVSDPTGTDHYPMKRAAQVKKSADLDKAKALLISAGYSVERGSIGAATATQGLADVAQAK